MSWQNRTYRITKDGGRVDGVFSMAFIHNDYYHLTHISVYQDGMIDCWELVNFDEFRQRVRSGWVVTQLPDSARIGVWPLATFRATDANYSLEPEELIKEVADEIEELNGRPTTVDRCREAWAAYQSSPSETTKDALRVAYAATTESGAISNCEIWRTL